MFTDNPVISAVMPTYNCAPYIKEAVISVINQTENNWELLILDDHSTDGTLEQLKNVKDPRIKIYKSEYNHGQAYQLNKGVNLSTGNYIAIVHGDDINHPERFKAQLRVFQYCKSLDVVGSQIEYIGQNSGIWKVSSNSVDCFVKMAKECPLAHPTVMIKKKALNKLDVVYKQEMVPAEDYDLWVRLSPFCKFYNIPRVLLYYRIHSNQIGNLKKADLYDKLTTIRNNYIRINYPNLDLHAKSTFIKLLEFSAESTITKSFIKKSKSLPYFLVNNRENMFRIWNKHINQWLYQDLLITKKYERGAGIYFLIKTPSMLLKGNIINTLRIITRSVYFNLFM